MAVATITPGLVLESVVPLGPLDRAWYYALLLAMELAAAYFLVVSGRYRVVTNRA